MRNLCLCLALAAAPGGAACGGDDDGAPPDAAPPSDGYVVVDGAPRVDADVLAWVDFATDGCTLVTIPAGDGGAPRTECHGAAPLTVRFAPVVPSTVDAYLWTFGDGGSSGEPTPTHVFALPGAYDVGLSVAGPGGTATAARPGWIVVAPAPAGAACTASAQCGDGASCLCGDGATCDGGWTAGACATPCDDASDCAGGVCARLGGDGSTAPWAGGWCLPACDDATACADGRACAVVRADDGAWARACVPAGALAPLGASCAGPAGLDDDRCASGDCAPLGLRGACSASCADVACPAGATCATFAGALGARCIVDCTGADGECTADPWQTCVAPGGPGDLGFTVDGDARTYCAPRPCASPEDCPGGTCSGGYCRPSL